MSTAVITQLPEYTQPSAYMDFDQPTVAAFAAKYGTGNTDVEKAINLYYAVRDGFWYDPYHINMGHNALKASALIARGSGYCGEKANFLAAVARACGIPARLGFATVRNHIGVEKLQEILQSDLFVFHGFTELYLNGKWVKATPAFNKELCQKVGVQPLEFDGVNDSIFQEYDHAGNKHMEYVHNYGVFTEVPRDLMISELKKYYPHLFEGPKNNANGHYFITGDE